MEPVAEAPPPADWRSRQNRPANTRREGVTYFCAHRRQGGLPHREPLIRSCRDCITNQRNRSTPVAFVL